MHIHVNALQATITFAEVILAMFLVRAISYTWPDSKAGKALAAIT